MSLFAVSGGVLWEALKPAPSTPRRDPERPTGCLRPVEGREADAVRAARALAELHSITRDDRLQGEIVRALICAGVVEVNRG